MGEVVPLAGAVSEDTKAPPPRWAYKASEIAFANRAFSDPEWLVKFARYVDGPRNKGYKR